MWEFVKSTHYLAEFIRLAQHITGLIIKNKEETPFSEIFPQAKTIPFRTPLFQFR